MRLKATCLLVLTLVIAAAPSSSGDDLSPTSAPVAEAVPLAAAIDAAILEQLQRGGILPAPTVGDPAYLRRVMLDLAGRIPTAKELAEFSAQAAPNKREECVDRLLASPDFALHDRNELDILLLARLQWNAEWRSYLLVATQEHRPWDQLVREILLPEKHRADHKGAAAFLMQRASDLDAMTNDTSTLLFGVNIACAKCHDHPLVPDWHQDHYFGFASFFKRTFATRRGTLAERFDGELKFTTTQGEEKQSKFMFLNGRVIDEAPIERTDEQWAEIREQLKKAEQDDKAPAPPVPPFSPREKLLELAFESRDQPLLARNLANRLWARLMGHGLVHPLDQMHSGNLPSHPELLDRLTSELLQHAYDPRPLLRGIVLSQAYARSSRLDASATPSAREQFAVRIPRALTPFQYSLSLWIASRSPESLPGWQKNDQWLDTRTKWEERSEGFARRFEIPDDNHQISVEEALMLSNSPQAESEFLTDQNDTLIGHLKSLADFQKQIDAVYSTILSREPSSEEREAVTRYWQLQGDHSDAARRQLVWALLTSAEFRFNH